MMPSIPSTAIVALGATIAACATVPVPPSRGLPEPDGARADAGIVHLPLTELARRVRERELSSRELVEAFVRQIATHHDEINAIVLLDLEGARARASEADAALARGELWGPLHGVPITIKDSLAVGGLRTTAGYPELRDHVPADDAPAVALLREAGAIILGKTNLAMLAMDMQSVNPLFGRTNNPWDLSRTAGGSTGGGAAALASGMTPLSIGSDLAGSIRLPAAFNGVYGLLPTHGVVSLRGHVPPLPGEVNGFHEMARVGPLARSIDDLELALRILNRPHPAGRRVSPLPARTSSAPLDPSTLRIAWTDGFADAPVSREIREELRAFVARLRAAGVEMVELPHDALDYERAWDLWGAMVGHQGGYERSNAARRIGKFFMRRRIRGVPMHQRILDPIDVPSYMEVLSDRDAAVDEVEALLADYDGFLCPVAATVAFPHHELSTRMGHFPVYDEPLLIDGQSVHYYVATQAYTTPFALTENPVLSMPIGMSADGLPIGMQLVGPRFGDHRLLAVGRALAEYTSTMRYPFGAETEL